jgi:hypothetical protein
MKGKGKIEAYRKRRGMELNYGYTVRERGRRMAGELLSESSRLLSRDVSGFIKVLHISPRL